MVCLGRSSILVSDFRLHAERRGTEPGPSLNWQNGTMSAETLECNLLTETLYS